MSVDGRVEGDPDVLVLCRVMGDYVPDAVCRIVKAGRTTVIYDTDDWFGGIPEYNPASKLPPTLVDTMHAAMREAHLVTVSTPELAEAYAVLNRTVVLPNYLDPRIWRPWQEYTTPRTFVSVGWAGAFHWRGGDLDLLKPWVHQLLERNPDVRFAAIGCPELLQYLDVDGITTKDLPETDKTTIHNRHLHPYHHMPAMLANLDLGLVPLMFNRFNQAKSWCKGMEYNAMGVPAVASPSREYRRFIDQGVNGYLVRGREWLRTVERSLAELDVLQKGARQHAERFFIDDHIGDWVAAYSMAAVAA
jgi:glycosyltransferase involved in cell wall biosynthesis